MNNSITSAEELYETLIDLENERVISRKINQESDNLLKGLKLLVERFNEKNILVDIISILRDIVGCEDIIIMTTGLNHAFITKAATSDFFYNIQLEPQEFFKRILSGDISISFDVQSIPEWRSLFNKLNSQIKSAIHIRIGFSEKDTLLICFDSRLNFFNHAHADLIKRYSTLITQALINISSQEKINALNKDLLNKARQSGMADVAISVLHGIGNVLNNMSISSEILHEKIKNISLTKLSEFVDFIKEKPNEKNRYFIENPDGNKMLEYLSLIAQQANAEKLDLLEEITSMNIHIDHIKSVVSMQQEISKPSNVRTKAAISTIIDSILTLQNNKIAINKITLVRHYKDELLILTDQYQLEKIIRNLIQNAVDSLIVCNNMDKQLIISCDADNDENIIIQVIDNGLGIPPEDINKIFNFGFTTKNEGHGFGLHDSALTAKELGGELKASSKGLGQGAVFTLTLNNSRF